MNIYSLYIKSSKQSLGPFKASHRNWFYAEKKDLLLAQPLSLIGEPAALVDQNGAVIVADAVVFHVADHEDEWSFKIVPAHEVDKLLEEV